MVIYLNVSFCFSYIIKLICWRLKKKRIGLSIVILCVVCGVVDGLGIVISLWSNKNRIWKEAFRNFNVI